MTKPNLKLIAGDRYDASTSASALCSDFKLGVRAEQRVADCLAYLDARRFAIPYSEGLQLALTRPFGAEVRNLVAQPGLTAKMLYSLDYRTCDEAGMLELHDRLGIVGAFAVVGLLPLADLGFNVMPAITRTEPADFEDVMPLMREALARVFNDLTGAKPDRRRDFAKKKGVVYARPGRMAAFICRGLSLAGWTFTPKQVVYNYDAVLAPLPWGRQQRTN